MSIPETEESVLRFWKEHRIFEKTVEARKGKKSFVFYEGPPTANGLPHIGHFLTRCFKDVILRFRTMTGYHVPRRAGWDTHGLPVEVEIEKKKGFTSKRDIENYGIAAFNQACKESVWQYKKEWERYSERMGFWLDLSDPYITYDPHYMESLWWIIAQWFKKGLFKREFKVVPYCTRCSTPLSNHELNQPDAWKEVQDTSVYLKLRVHGTQNDFILVWTTTPWTLIANSGVAVNPDLMYVKVRTRDHGNLWIAKGRASRVSGETVEEKKGKHLVGLVYDPLFRELTRETTLALYPAAYVSDEEGTGFVHISPAFGEEDLAVARAHKLPFAKPVNAEGLFDFSKQNAEQTPFVRALSGKPIREGNGLILEEMQRRGALFLTEETTHLYPHCWRCKHPLIYYALDTWLVKTSTLKAKTLANNKKINWVPEHVRDGRFGEWLKEGRDWNFSRNRYWGTPIPVWMCDRCDAMKVAGRLEDIAQESRNTYVLMRHGGSRGNAEHRLCSNPEPFQNPLTPEGKAWVTEQAAKLGRIDLIIASPLLRTRETAEIVARRTGASLTFDERLREVDFGTVNGRPVSAYSDIVQDAYHQYLVRPDGGETLDEVRKRMIAVVRELEQAHDGKRILLVSHGAPIHALIGEMQGMGKAETIFRDKYYLRTGAFIEVPYRIFPRNDDGEIDIHRPFIDAVTFPCACGGVMRRTPELADVWFDSGAMPFAQANFPFAQTKRSVLAKQDWKKFLPRIAFPGDYIVEGIDQTRGWFYTLLAVSTLLDIGPAYRNVIALNLVLDKSGKKMSKSLGNVVSPMEMMEKYGADPLRMYFYTVNQPGENKRFDEADLQKLTRNFFLILSNIHNFYRTYYTAQKSAARASRRTLLDRWMQLRFTETQNLIIDRLDAYDVVAAGRSLLDVLDDFSRWWLRRSRERFQKPKNAQELSAALLTLEEFLHTFSVLLAPFAPFAAESLYRDLLPELRTRNASLPESVHLESLKRKAVSAPERKILERMAYAKRVASEALALRQELNLKVRQPLAELVVVAAASLPAEFGAILADEVNVKRITFRRSGAEQALRKNKNLFERKAGAMSLFLDTVITDALRDEGTLREVIRGIQGLRQKGALKPQERATVLVSGNDAAVAFCMAHRTALESATRVTLREGERDAATRAEVDCEGTLGRVYLTLA